MKPVHIALLVSLLLFAVVLSGCVNPSVCGNGICELGESYKNCPVESGGDCPPPELCGDGQCDTVSGENHDNCPEDCVQPETHSECIDYQCVLVSEPGISGCSVDADCFLGLPSAAQAESIELGLLVSDAGKVTLSSLMASPSLPTDELSGAPVNDDGYFSLAVTTATGIGYYSFKPEFMLFTNPPIILDETIYPVSIPFFGARTIDVDFEGSERLSLNIPFLLCNSNSVCDSYENFFSCPSDCTDAYAEDDICNSEYDDYYCDWDCYWTDGDETDPEAGECFKPNCNDGVMNGEEVGVDCGGPCKEC